MPKPDLERLLERIDRHLAKTGMKPTMFGKKAAGTPNLMARLRQAKKDGKGITLATIQRVSAYLDENR